MAASLVRILPVMAAVALMSPALHAQSSDEARVRALVLESQRAFEAGDRERNRDVLRQLWSLRKTYDIAANLARAEFDLNNDAAAATYLAFALRHFPPRESEQEFEKLDGHFSTLKSKVITLRMSIDPSYAAVRIDGAPPPEAPLGPEIFLPPGRHVIQAEHDGRTAKRVVDGRAGEELALQIVIPPLPPPSPSVPEPELVRSAPVAERVSPIPFVVGGALSLIGLGAGVAFHLNANAAADDRQRRLDALPMPIDRGSCRASAPSSGLSDVCGDLQELSRRVDRSKNWSLVSFALGGTAAVGTAVYWLWTETRGTSSTARSFLVPSLGPGSVGVSALSTF